MNSKLRSMHGAPIVSCLCLPFPAARVDFPVRPDRRRIFCKKLLGPQTILKTIPGAVFDIARGFPRQWDRSLGVAGRMRSQHGHFVVGERIELALFALHRDGPRSFRMTVGNCGPRLRHSLAGTVDGCGADGSNTIGLARLANVYGGWAVATSWNAPDQRNAGKIAARGTGPM